MYEVGDGQPAYVCFITTTATRPLSEFVNNTSGAFTVQQTWLTFLLRSVRYLSIRKTLLPR